MNQTPTKKTAIIHLSLFYNIARIIFICQPIGRIFLYVFPDSIQFIFIMNEMFVVISLPIKRNTHILSNCLSGLCLEKSDNLAQGQRMIFHHNPLSRIIFTISVLLQCRGLIHQTLFGINLNDFYDPVKMIWHDHELIYIDIREIRRDLTPRSFSNYTHFIQKHCGIGNLSKKTFAFFCTNGHKIKSGPGIIISLQADRTAPVSLRFQLFSFGPGTSSGAIPE